MRPETAVARGAVRITVQAPAKINLDLYVVGRRPDGYHLLDSLVTPISMHDTLRITCRRGDRISLRANVPSLPRGRDNLAWRAADLLLRHSGVRAAVAIDLTKRIPAGAGLGGGSSDAAAVLRALDALLKLRSTPPRLAELGLQLGADVPFFLLGRPAILRGVGERLRPVPGFRRRWLVVTWPGFAVSTQWAYRAYDVSLTKRHRPPKIRNSARGDQPLYLSLVNVLEPVVAAAHPQLQGLKRRLLELGARGASMTGSGSAVFGLFSNREQAQRGAARLRREGTWARAVHTVNRTDLSR